MKKRRMGRIQSVEPIGPHPAENRPMVKTQNPPPQNPPVSFPMIDLEETPVPNCRKLAALIVEQAIDDYNFFVSIGLIQGMKIAEDKWEFRTFSKTLKSGETNTFRRWVLRGGDGEKMVRRNQKVERDTLERLLHFLQNGMDEWIDVASIDLDPETIRAGLCGMTRQKAAMITAQKRANERLAAKAERQKALGI